MIRSLLSTAILLTSLTSFADIYPSDGPVAGPTGFEVSPVGDCRAVGSNQAMTVYLTSTNLLGIQTGSIFAFAPMTQARGNEKIYTYQSVESVTSQKKLVITVMDSSPGSAVTIKVASSVGAGSRSEVVFSCQMKSSAL